MPGLSGEYRITVYEEDRLSRFDLEVEYDPKETDRSEKRSEELTAQILHSIKTRLGVKPKKVTVLESGTLPRFTHKAKRLVDNRPKG